MSFILTLAINDLARSYFFYRHILDFPVKRFGAIEEAPEALIIRQNNAGIILRPASMLLQSHPVAFEHLGRTPFGAGVSLDFRVGNLKKIEQNIQKHMIPILYELEDQEHDRSEIWLYDPSGYLVTLCQEGAK